MLSSLEYSYPINKIGHRFINKQVKIDPIATNLKSNKIGIDYDENILVLRLEDKKKNIKGLSISEVLIFIRQLMERYNFKLTDMNTKQSKRLFSKQTMKDFPLLIANVIEDEEK